MEISWILSWIGVILFIIGIIWYALYKNNKISGLRMPKWFEPKSTDLTEQLKVQTEQELAKAEELKKVLEAKRKLATVKAGNIQLRKEIGGVSAKSVEKERQEQEEADRQAGKPRRL